MIGVVDTVTPGLLAPLTTPTPSVVVPPLNTARCGLSQTSLVDFAPYRIGAKHQIDGTN